MINKPTRVVVGVEVGRRQAMILHAMLNIIGVGIGIYLSFYIKLPALSLVFMLATGLLWFYSTTYKRQFLVGNLSVSFLTGLVPMMVVLFEIPLLNRVYGEQMLLHNASFNYIFAWVAGFSFFAFLSTLIRELIKDAEDFEGDSAYGMRTVPIVLGPVWTKTIVVGLIAGYPGYSDLPFTEVHSVFRGTGRFLFTYLFCYIPYYTFCPSVHFGDPG